MGKIDMIVQIIYVLLIGKIGGMMIVERVKEMRREKKGKGGEVRS